VTLAGIVDVIRQHAPAAAAGVVPGGRAGAAGAGEVAVVLELGVTPGEIRFDQEELRVAPGQTGRVVLTNTDHMEHNLLFLRPGSLERVGRMADEMMHTPDARQRQYVPDTADVIAFTPVLEPAQRYELTFTAPTEPGEYPFTCTVPGHWRLMQGVLIVGVPSAR
jgi:uncharacterized protein